MTYMDFLRSKIVTAPETGFTVSDSDINPALKPHQRDAVKWAVAGGRRGLFERFGLGKTVQELEYCRIVTEHEGGKALIVLPLGVRQEFTHDAVQLLGMEPPRYVRTMQEAQSATETILLTNYERVRDGDIDPAGFTACCLDEASVLRSFGSKTYQTFLDKFRGVRFKLVATATPSPNRYKELIHYAGFLEVMDTVQAFIIPACAVDAPHRRDRVCIVGWKRSACNLFYSNSESAEYKNIGKSEKGKKEQPWISRLHTNVSDTKSTELQGRRETTREWRAKSGCSSRRSAQPGLGGVADGISRWMDRGMSAPGCWMDEPDIPRITSKKEHRADRLKCLGNAVVPQQFYPVFQAIADIERGFVHG